MRGGWAAHKRFHTRVSHVLHKLRNKFYGKLRKKFTESYDVCSARSEKLISTYYHYNDHENLEEIFYISLLHFMYFTG